jgi:hypothetical protein
MPPRMSSPQAHDAAPGLGGSKVIDCHERNPS